MANVPMNTFRKRTGQIRPVFPYPYRYGMGGMGDDGDDTTDSGTDSGTSDGSQIVTDQLGNTCTQAQMDASGGVCPLTLAQANAELARGWDTMPHKAKRQVEAAIEHFWPRYFGGIRLCPR